MIGGAVSWEDLTAAGAFVLGAVLATIACLRVVRAVVSVFDDSSRSPRRRLFQDEDDSSSDRKDQPRD